jgi:hypothetical protein
MAEPLTLVNINIERDKHWDRVLPFVARIKPDVLCIQECYEDDVSRILGYPHQVFLPITRRPRSSGGAPIPFGILVCAKEKFDDTDSVYYHSGDALPIADESTDESIYASYWRGYIRVDQGPYRILTTHFTWTPNGEATSYQEKDLSALKAALSTEGEHIICGDFNLPRGKNALWPMLVEGYSDCIPTHYASSIDLELHRFKDDPERASHLKTYMVDHLLTTPKYLANNVRLESGVSDHKAIVATILLAE